MNLTSIQITFNRVDSAHEIVLYLLKGTLNIKLSTYLFLTSILLKPSNLKHF